MSARAMTALHRTLSLLLLSVSLAPAAHAYVRSTTGAPARRPIAWSAGPVPFVIDAAGSADAPAAAVYTAVRRGFAAWELPCSWLRFRDDGVRAGLVSEYVTGGVNENVVRWSESTWTGPASQIAYTTVTFSASTGEILDTDMTFNGRDYQFSAGSVGVSGFADVQAVATHEAGHVLGLDHTTVPGATMLANIGLGELFPRDLADDDIAGVCAIYPPKTPVPPTGVPLVEGGCAAAGALAEGLGSTLLALAALALARRRRRCR